MGSEMGEIGGTSSEKLVGFFFVLTIESWDHPSTTAGYHGFIRRHQLTFDPPFHFYLSTSTLIFFFILIYYATF